MAQIQVRQKRSTIGQSPVVRRTVKALGLGKINSRASFDKTLDIEGMIRIVRHLVEVTEVR